MCSKQIENYMIRGYAHTAMSWDDPERTADKFVCITRNVVKDIVSETGRSVTNPR